MRGLAGEEAKFGHRTRTSWGRHSIHKWQASVMTRVILEECDSQSVAPKLKVAGSSRNALETQILESTEPKIMEWDPAIHASRSPQVTFFFLAMLEIKPRAS